MAQLLRETLRTTDSLGRYGGEEFVAVLPHTSPEEARQTAERIRYRVSAEPIPRGGQGGPGQRQRGDGVMPVGGYRLAGRACYARPTKPSIEPRKPVGTA